MNLAPPVHFYIAESNPRCLLIATVDGNTISNGKYHTAADYPLNDITNITIEDILKIRIIEFIFLLKDTISNENNHAWLYFSKKLFPRSKKTDRFRQKSTGTWKQYSHRKFFSLFPVLSCRIQ
jgi:hypothetical protein